MSFFLPRRRDPRSAAPSEGRLEAQAARLEAETVLDQVRREKPDVEHAYMSLQSVRTDNHFGDAVYSAMIRRKA